MNLSFTYADLFKLLKNESINNGSPIHSLSIDTRTITQGESSMFVALKGSFKDGHEFIIDAYLKGVRLFVVTHLSSEFPKDAFYIVVDDSIAALQKIALAHRSKFKGQVIAVTGSNGKTMVKEWLAELLGSKFNVMRSPKSYNSQIGVALSLLEISENDEIAIIEAGISEPNEMDALEKMIQPSMGILTNIGRAHLQNFNSQEQLLNEKMKLFKALKEIYTLEENEFRSSDARFLPLPLLSATEVSLNLADEISLKNLSIASGVAKKLGFSQQEILFLLKTLRPLANRFEIFEGRNNNLIINDSYSLDTTALRSSLSTQIKLAEGRKRIVIIGLDKNDVTLKKEVELICEEFKIDELLYHDSEKANSFEFDNACILIKGSRSANTESLAKQLRLKKHSTFLEIDLGKIRSNILQYKSKLRPETGIMTMVKASSYGSDAVKMGRWLERTGIQYLGVAFVEEGVELREKGVELPILVMNVDDFGFESCIKYQLEPSIYSLSQLDRFLKELIYSGIKQFPIHIKVETGMHRLGFEEEDLPKLLSILKAQPEVIVKSIYSHLATADSDRLFAKNQIARFEKLSGQLLESLPYPILRHILNSEGIIRFPEAQFDLVRLGIGMYGITSENSFGKDLNPALAWYTTISQIKNLKKGESVGYMQSFIAQRDSKVAVLAVGYADGFRRSLGNTRGEVSILGNRFPVIGNVCMDMIMVDITGQDFIEGQTVELFGEHISIYEIAEKLQTIPYEVFTSISTRVSRIYIDD